MSKNTNLSDQLVSRVPVAGCWNSWDYIRWRDGVNGSNVLWCHGIQGSDKTVPTCVLASFVYWSGLILSSSMVIDFKYSLAHSKTPIAFFYFNCRDQDRQTPTTFLSSILRQTVAAIPKIPSCVSDRYDKNRASSVSLPLHELEKMILEIASSICHTYLIVDALDECEELAHRRPILQLLTRLGQSPTSVYLSLVASTRTIFRQSLTLAPRSQYMPMNLISGVTCFSN